ncbi:MAG: hypothetical protein JO035_11485 [Betaproteobacteria bacterium]|nr:hypothetical protein [Betaproteobacteria bacterium]
MAEHATPPGASLRAVRGFARRRGISESEAVAVFEREFERLDLKAKVHRYVPLLAEKHARRILEGRSPRRRR